MTSTADLHAKAQAAYERIESDPRLTPKAKYDDKLRVWAQLDRDLTALGGADAAAKARRRDALNQQLFGLRPTATSYDRMARRDAQQRADSLDSEGSAARMMHSARSAGDLELVDAIAARAVSEGWRNLADAYVADVRPDAAAAIRELMDRDTRNITSRVIDSADFYAAIPLGLPDDRYRLRQQAEELDAADGIVRLPSPDAAHTMPSRLEALASQPIENVARDELEQFAIDLMNSKTPTPTDSPDAA